MNRVYDGLKVLDLSRFIAGPYCGMLLADMGADVVKVEKVNEGDTSRNLTPKINGESIYHFVLNRNKRSLKLDFRSPKGQEILIELIKKADVIIENFRPGTMEKMGCAPDKLKELNPGLIMVRISGFGQDGPYAERPGFDAIAQAMSGLMSITGQEDGPPTLGGTFYVDYMTAMYSTIGVMAALKAKEQTGKGQIVDATLLDSAVSVLLTAIPTQMLLNQTMTRVGNRDRYSAPANTFKTKDGDWVIFIAGMDPLFKRFVTDAHLEYLLEDERFNTFDSRLEHAKEIEDIVAEWVKQQTTGEVLRFSVKAGITCSKVESVKDVVENPQLHYRNKIIHVAHPVMGNVPMTAFPVNFSDMDFKVRYPAPVLGEHSGVVLKEWLNYMDDDIAGLKETGII